MGTLSNASITSEHSDGESRKPSSVVISPAKSNQGKAEVIKVIFGLRDKMNENDGAMSGKLGELYISHAATIASVNFQNDFVETLNKKMNEITDRKKVRDQKLNELAFELQETKAVLRTVQKETRENTLELKSKNLIINGIPEKQDENPFNTATNFLKNIDPAFTVDKIENAYRLGQAGGKGNRGLLIKFKDPLTKQSIMKKKSVLKSSKEHGKVFCNEDLPEDRRKFRQLLKVTAKYANSIGYKNTRVKGNSLWHEGRQYKEHELSLLPDCLKMENICTRDVGRGISFFSKYSFLSNHNPARFCMNEHRFMNSEQAYYYYIGVVCGRESTGNEIRKMLDPGETKKLGDQIPTCDEWEKRKFRIMTSVLTHKFEQNRPLRDKLIRTGNAALLECTTDAYWGTGWVLDSPNWNEPLDYPGDNNLGKILESIRENYLPVMAPFEPVPTGAKSGLKYTSTPMTKTASKSTKKRKNSQSSNPPPKQPVVHTSEQGEGDMRHSAVTPPKTGPGVVEEDMAVDHVQTSIARTSEKGKDEEIQLGATGGMAHNPIEQEKEQLTESQVLEVDELTFSDTLYLLYDAKNVTNKDGSLNVDKIRSWGSPPLNTSCLMEVTGYGTDGARQKLTRLSSAQNAGESYVESGQQVETVTRKTLTASRQPKPESEKRSLTNFLKMFETRHDGRGLVHKVL